MDKKSYFNDITSDITKALHNAFHSYNAWVAWEMQKLTKTTHFTLYINSNFNICNKLSSYIFIYQGHFPGRMKAFHYYNAGAIIEALMAFFKTFMKKKYQERVSL